MVFTYPHFDVEIERSVVPERLAWPASGEAMDESSLGCNRDYADLRRLPWLEARRVYSVEEKIIARIEASQDTDEEYELVVEELNEDSNGIYGLDIGVASAVVALSAARCIPFSSCNGGAFGGSHHESHPVVAFFAQPEITPLLLECAEEAGSGLSMSEFGSLIVYADDIRNMRAFACALIKRKTAFRKLRFSANAKKRKQRDSQDQTQLNLF